MSDNGIDVESPAIAYRQGRLKGRRQSAPQQEV